MANISPKNMEGTSNKTNMPGPRGNGTNSLRNDARDQNRPSKITRATEIEARMNRMFRQAAKI